MQNDSRKFAYVRMGSLNAREMFQRRAGKQCWEIAMRLAFKRTKAHFP